MIQWTAECSEHTGQKECLVRDRAGRDRIGGRLWEVGGIKMAFEG